VRGGWGTINITGNLSYTSWRSSSGFRAIRAPPPIYARCSRTEKWVKKGQSAVENVVGLKPTLGLVSQAGIFPIAHRAGHSGYDWERRVLTLRYCSARCSRRGAKSWASAPERLHAFSTRLTRRCADAATFVFDYSYFGSGIRVGLIDRRVCGACPRCDGTAYGATIVDTATRRRV